ncbi:MAG: AAA domain-containing protein [Akkermansiaceae bacterium]
MITIAQLINTASQSTASYLALLTQANKGGTRHSASNVRPSPKNVALVGNQSWPVILCELPKHEKFPPDSGAIFVSSSHPGKQIGAQILDYDSRSGRAEIAVEEMPSGEEGELVIDFKWLIKRCLDWLTKNGSNISNPFLLPTCDSVHFRPAVSHVSLSGEQSDAIQSLLSNPVGYVWGPPGTGKTRHVLAETVASLIGAGKRVIVTAPTNLAVDNALDAVLRLSCVPDHQILRLGIPSPDFSLNWPECCEEKALQGKLKELEAHALLIAKRMDSRRRSEELDGLIREQKEIADIFSKLEGDADEACLEMNRQISEVENRLSVATNACRLTEQKIGEKRTALASLKLDELRNGIAALEVDQMNLVAARQSLEKELGNIGWLTRVFTKKRGDLERRRSEIDRRIADVEGTLKSQRQRSGVLESQGAKLQAEIAVLEPELLSFLTARQEGELAQNQLTTNLHQLIERQNLAKTESDEAGGKLKQMLREQEELMSFGELPDESAIASLGAELIAVRKKMAKITQDLSQKLVLGMTLDGFIGLTMNQALHFDHIVVDEAGYAPLAKVLPLLIQGCPISLLGDHRQLPPIYEGKKDVLSESYWGVSALYLEEAFQSGIGDDPQQMVIFAQKDPRFQKMHRNQLTMSYRFGPELADLLDRHFYKIGLRSHGSTGTDMRSRNCPQTGPVSSPSREKRENPAEANRVMKAVKSWVEWEPDSDKGTLAILTPYTKQVRLIQDSLKSLGKSNDIKTWKAREWEDYGKIEVMTVHRSQGREWDTVFFSASDTGRLAGNGPFLADTSCHEGKLVVNTAISRSKKYLRFFFDRQYWKDRAMPSLLSEVAESDLRVQKASLFQSTAWGNDTHLSNIE